VDGVDADVYVADERGSIFTQRVSFFDRAALEDHFKVFFESVLHRQRNDVSVDGTDVPSAAVEFYEAVKDESGNRRLLKPGSEPARVLRNYFSIQVIGHAGEDDRSQLTIYCNDVEFPGLEYGERLYGEVAAFVLKQRRGGARYPIYITDIDLPRSMLGGAPGARIQTIHFLNYKKQIEDQLRLALDRLYLP